MNKSNKTCLIYGVKEKYISSVFSEIDGLKSIVSDTIEELILNFNFKSFIFVLDYNTSFLIFDELVKYREVIKDLEIIIIKAQRFDIKLFPKNERAKINSALKKADKTILVCNQSYQREMRSAIDAGILYSNCLMCIWDLKAGNTSYALTRAQYFNKPVICINSNNNQYFDYSRSNFLIKR